MRGEDRDAAGELIDPPGTPESTGAVVLAVVGPTASGKTALSLDLAEQLGGEIVNADASQLYRGMDIGTAKIPVTERRGIPHHQLDVLDIAEEASVAAYQRHARADVAGILARGRLPIVVGGSGLYVRALLDQLEIPPTDSAVRARLEHDLETEGVEAMRARLHAADPEAAARIEPRNGRRIVRALEVVELTGRPFSATMPRRDYVRPTVVVGLRPPRPELDARIAQRTRQMWRDGFLDEVAALAARGLAQTRTASRALGYAQALDQLAGTCSEEDAIAATITATRRLVRRQESWFGPDPRIRWLPVRTPEAMGGADVAGETVVRDAGVAGAREALDAVRAALAGYATMSR